MNAQSLGISQRRFIVSAGFIAAALSLTPRQSFGAEQNLVAGARASGAKAKIAIQALRGNVSALIGSGGNIAVLPGSDGKLIVDSGYLSSREKIAAALDGISRDPVKNLVNTHWHFDHTDGNEWMHSAGATIMAHENTKKHLSTTTRVDDWDFTFPPLPVAAIPTKITGAEKTLHLNGATVALKYYDPARTDGDISIYFTEADVLHTGDTWWNGYYPFVDYSTGGSITGMIKAAEANLAMVTDKTIIFQGTARLAAKPK